MKRQLKLGLFVALLLVCGLATLSLAAPSHAPLQATTTLTASQEVGVKQPDWDPTTPTSQRLRFGGYNDGEENHFYRSFIAFDLSGIPADATISNATLIMTVFGTSPVFSGTIPISAYRVTTSWTENITWTQQPSFEASALTSQGIDATVPTTYTWDITNLAQGWASDSYDNYGVMLAGDPPDADPINGMLDGAAVARRSTDPDGPQLRITYSQAAAAGEAPVAIPEANTLLLLASGLASLAGYARWRQIRSRRP